MSEEIKNTTEEKEVVTIEVPEVEEVVQQQFDTEGLMPQEIEMAKEHGLVIEEKDDGEHEESTEPKTEEDTGSEEKPEEEVVDKPAFEDAEKDETLTEKYNPNEKALYWKWKNDKKKRQNLEREVEELRAKVSPTNPAADAKLKKISEALGNENLTVEQLQAIIDGKEKSEDAPLTRADLAAIDEQRKLEASKVARQNQEFNDRLKLIELVGVARHDDFTDIVKLAEEIASKDSTYSEILSSAFNNKDLDEEAIVERVVTIAKLNPNWGKNSGDTEESSKEVGRVIKNSKKKISSAAVTGGKGSSTITEDTLTVDQAGRLSAEQWSKLGSKTKKRILMGIDP